MWTLPWILQALVAAPSGLAQPNPSSAATKRELGVLFGRVIDAIQRRDTATLAAIYAPNYRFALGGGDSVTTLSRAERLQSVAGSPDNIRTLTLERCDVELFPTFAVGGCWIREQSMTNDRGAWAGIYTTVVFRRVGGRWTIVSSHASVNRPKPS